MTQNIHGKPDIVSIIESEGLSLKKRGRDLWTICPFHPEKTPSFKVCREKQSFYCFGCGKGGDVITFIMLYHNLSFKDALDYLGLNGRPSLQPTDPVKVQKRKLIESFRTWEQSYYRALCRKRLLLIHMTRDLATMEEVEERAPLIHALPMIEHKLDILWHGSDEEKFILWREVKNGI